MKILFFCFIVIALVGSCQQKLNENAGQPTLTLLKSAMPDEFLKIFKKGYFPTEGDFDYFYGNHDESEIYFFDAVCSINHWDEKKCKDYFEKNYNMKPTNDRPSFYLLWIKKRFPLGGKLEILSRKTSRELNPQTVIPWPYEIIEAKTANNHKVTFLMGTTPSALDMQGHMALFEVDGLKVNDVLEKDLKSNSKLIVETVEEITSAWH